MPDNLFRDILVEKVSPIKLADMAIMKAMGIPHEEIAEKLDISVRTVERYVSEWRKRAGEIGPHQAFMEVVLNAGPTWGIFRLTPLKMTPEEVFEELRKTEEEK